MPGASKGSFKAGTPKRAPSQKKLSRSAQSSKAPAPTIAKPAAHGGKRALLEGRASLLVKLVTRKESALNLLSLAQIYVDLEKLSKAKEALERCLALDPADALQARCLLAPLLLPRGGMLLGQRLPTAVHALDVPDEPSSLLREPQPLAR